MNNNGRKTERTQKRDRYRKKNKNKRVRVEVISIIVLLLCLSVGVIAFAQKANENHQSDQSSASGVSEEKLQKSEESQVSEEISEPSEEPVSFRTEAKYTKATDQLSEKAKKKLNEIIESEYVVLYDATADKILYSKNGNKKCYPASTTKILTAVVSSKYLDKDEIIIVGDEIRMIGEDSSIAYLREGMEIPYAALLDAMMLPSGNDAAYTVAVASAKKFKDDPTLGNEECIQVFAQMMNDAAKEMGCTGSHFTCPDGFHDDDHYVTAEDMVKIGAYAVTIPVIMDACIKTEASWKVNAPVLPSEEEEEDENDSGYDEDYEDEYYEDTENSTEDTISSSEEPVSVADTVTEMSETELYWVTHNRLVEEGCGQFSEFATGLKTGYTDEAWTCVVASATMDGHTMIAAVMKSTSNYQKFREANYLFEEAFKLYDLDYTHNDEWVD